MRDGLTAEVAEVKASQAAARNRTATAVTTAIGSLVVSVLLWFITGR